MYDRDSGTKARSSLSGMEEDQEGVERLRSRLGMAGTISEIDPINPLRNGNGNQNQERERGRERRMEKREEEREEEEREREKRKQRNTITTDYLLPLLYSPWQDNNTYILLNSLCPSFNPPVLGVMSSFNPPPALTTTVPFLLSLSRPFTARSTYRLGDVWCWTRCHGRRFR